MPRRGGLARPSTQALSAFLAYGLASALLFGLPLFPHFTTTYLGTSDPRATGYTDPSIYQWLLVWWPHAIGHGLNPLVSKAIWAPYGVNLAAAQSIPAVALAASPLTLWLGPLGSYNAVALSAPALSGWAAFLLCRQLAGRFWPAFAGGFVYGFSSYELAELTSHLNLALAFAAPLAVYLVLRFLRGTLGRRAFVVLLAALLVLQFAISPEVLLTLVLFGVLLLLFALLLSDRALRSRVLGGLPAIGVAAGIAGVVLVPYLYWFFRSPPMVAPRLGSRFPNDLANLVVPTRIARFGGTTFSSVTARFHAGLEEEGGYFGLLLAPCLLFVVAERKRLAARLAALVFVAALVLSWGSRLNVAGRSVVPMPWALTDHVPLLHDAIPARLVDYAWLAAAAMVAMWLAGAHGPRPARARWAAVAVSVLLLLPTAAPLWRNAPPTPAFFSRGVYRSYIRPGENVLVIPFGPRGFAPLWQAETFMYFRMPEGHVSSRIPPSFTGFGIVSSLLSGRSSADSAAEVRRFVRETGVSAVVVARGRARRWEELFAGLGNPPLHVAGVLLYRLGPVGG